MIWPSYPPMTSDPLGHHDPYELHRREIQHERLVRQLSRARQLQRWADRVSRIAMTLSEAAAALRARVVGTSAR